MRPLKCSIAGWSVADRAAIIIGASISAQIMLAETLRDTLHATFTFG